MQSPTNTTLYSYLFSCYFKILPFKLYYYCYIIFIVIIIVIIIIFFVIDVFITIIICNFHNSHTQAYKRRLLELTLGQANEEDDNTERDQDKDARYLQR